jgi:hypothetical protein
MQPPPVLAVLGKAAFVVPPVRPLLKGKMKGKKRRRGRAATP